MEEVHKKTFMSKLKEFGVECKRVLKVTKKPTMQEFKIIVIVTGIGILIVGFIGFLITITRQLLF